MCLGIHQQAGWFRTTGSVGGTPTDAVETTALLKKLLGGKGPETWATTRAPIQRSAAKHGHSRGRAKTFAPFARRGQGREKNAGKTMPATPVPSPRHRR